MSTSPVTSPATTFTGISSFAGDLQSALTRAISIASLPIQQLTDQKNQFDSQAAELGQLGTLFTTLQSAVQSLSSGTGTGALSATSSDSSILQASLNGSALPGTYTIQVLDPGSSSSALSNEGASAITDPSSQSISASGTFTLTVGTNTYQIQPSAQNLNSLAASINSSGAPVQATIINLGSPSSPDYRLALQSTNLGDVNLQLNDGNSDLLSGVTTGTTASYTVNGQPSGTVNGQPAGITSDSSTVTIAPGLSVSLKTTGTATVTVAASTANISSALTSFVNAFNAAVTELQKNRGQTGGALTGDSIVSSLSDTLRQIANYTSSDTGINSLIQLGVQFTQQGTLSFDPTQLSGLSQDQINQAMTFLGDPNASGFLQAATNSLNSLIDPVTGLITNDLQTVESESQQEAQAISDAQDRVNQLSTNLQAQMSAADAAIAALQQQTQLIAGLFNIPQLNPNGTLSSSGTTAG